MLYSSYREFSTKKERFSEFHFWVSDWKHSIAFSQCGAFKLSFVGWWMGTCSAHYISWRHTKNQAEKRDCFDFPCSFAKFDRFCVFLSSYSHLLVTQEKWKNLATKMFNLSPFLPSKFFVQQKSVRRKIVAFILWCNSTQCDHIPAVVCYHLLYRPKFRRFFSTLCVSRMFRIVWHWYYN